ITRLRRRFCRHGNPIISVDAKKRELVGNFKNPGRKWERVPTPVNDHDFRSIATGIALPFGIYDPQANRGSVFVGVSHETSAFAVTSISRWWGQEGRLRYPNSRHLLILADTGGSNSATRGAWKDQLQQHLCDVLGLTVTVAHYPTGATKYNPIERRLFSQISRNWAAEPLTDYDTILSLIRRTTTTTGLQGHEGVSTESQTACAKITRTANHAPHNPPQVELHHRSFQWEIILARSLSGVGADPGERGLHRFLHDGAELSGHDETFIATGHAAGFDEQDVAAHRGPGETDGDTGAAGAIGD